MFIVLNSTRGGSPPYTLQEHQTNPTNVTVSKGFDIEKEWWSIRKLIFKCFKEVKKCIAIKNPFSPTGSGEHVTFLFTFGKSVNITVILIYCAKV